MIISSKVVFSAVPSYRRTLLGAQGADFSRTACDQLRERPHECRRHGERSNLDGSAASGTFRMSVLRAC